MVMDMAMMNGLLNTLGSCHGFLPIQANFWMRVLFLTLEKS